MSMGIKDKAKSTQRKIRNNQNKKYTLYGILMAVFVFSFIGLMFYVNQYKQEVDVVSFNQDMVDRALVEDGFLTKKSISKSDYESGMVKWENRKQFKGNYTAHFVRAGVPVYEDMFTEEQALRTSYLYELDGDEELLTFPYNISDAGGKLVTPGDRLRIRGSYAEGKDSNGSKDIKSDIIFDVVEVQDLLNNSNESIVDVITDANRLPQKDREELMKSEEFINKVTPKAILMVVKTKDIDKYVQFQAAEAPKYTLTMLTRNDELKSNELNTGNSLLKLLEQVKKGDSATN